MCRRGMWHEHVCDEDKLEAYSTHMDGTHLVNCVFDAKRTKHDACGQQMKCGEIDE